MRFCVTSLNPAIDAEWRVDDVLWEEKNIVYTQRRWPGGKGVNVARWLKFLGADSELLIPLGGPAGREMKHGLRLLKLMARVVPLQEETRVNCTR
jgi:6-phosphofructokinase 2